jgi:Bacterial Ig domain
MKSGFPKTIALHQSVGVNRRFQRFVTVFLGVLALTQAADALTLSLGSSVYRIDAKGNTSNFATTESEVIAFAMSAQIPAKRGLWIATVNSIEFRDAQGATRWVLPSSTGAATRLTLKAIPDSDDAYLLNGNAIYRLDAVTGETRHLSTLSVEATKILDLSVGLDGAIWLLTQSALHRVGAEGSTTVRSLALHTHAARALALDSVANLLWIASDDGLISLPTSPELTLTRPIGFVTNVPTQLIAVEPDNGRLWAVSQSRLLTALPSSAGAGNGMDAKAGEPLSWRELPESVSADVRRIEFDRSQQTLWAIAPNVLQGFTCCASGSSSYISTTLPRSSTVLSQIPYAPRPKAGLIGFSEQQAVSSPITGFQIQLESVCEGEAHCDVSRRYRNDLLLDVLLNGEQIGGEFEIDSQSGLATFIGTRHLPVGQSFLSYRALDVHGRSSETQQVRLLVSGDVRKANALPSVSFVTPVANQVFTAPATVALSVNASDSDGTISKVEFFRAATTLIGNGVLSSGKYNYNWTNVAAGTTA